MAVFGSDGVSPEIVWIARPPRCPTHGQMSPRGGKWICHGFDGEGCDHVVTEWLTWYPIGVTVDWYHLP